MESQIKKAIIIHDSKKTAPYRYRCQNFDEILKDSNKWQIIPFHKNSTKDIISELKSADLLILQRLKYSFKLQKIVKIAKKNQISTVYDLDDFVFSPKNARLIYQTTKDKNLFYWLRYTFLIHKAAKQVDGFIVSNDFLGQKLKTNFKKPYKVIRNFLSEQQVKNSKIILKTKKQPKNFTIGYFSGTKTHSKDFELIAPEIANFLTSHPNSKLKIVGDLNLSKSYDEFIQNQQIIFQEKVRFQKLGELMSTVNINLAPLVENDFTNCKSELKFFESAIVGVPTIASPTFAFKNTVKDKKTGFLCHSGEWCNCLEDLYNHPEKGEKIARAAREYCLENYYGNKIIKTIEDTYDFFAE